MKLNIKRLFLYFFVISTCALFLQCDTRNVSPTGFLNLFPARENLTYFEVTLIQDTLLYAVDGDEHTAMRDMLAGTRLTILARSNLRNNMFYLVNIDSDSTLWSGWIKSESVSPDDNEAIGRLFPPEKRLQNFAPNVSTRNDFFVTNTWDNDIIIVKKDGKIVHRIVLEEIFGLGRDGVVSGWTTDETKVWVQIMDVDTITNFVIINIHTGELTIFDAPPDVGVDWAINFDTGDILYSDFPIQHGIGEAQATRTSGKLFHLFIFNFLSEKKEIVDTNVGEGFYISFDKTNGFIHERMNYSEHN